MRSYFLTFLLALLLLAGCAPTIESGSLLDPLPARTATSTAAPAPTLAPTAKSAAPGSREVSGVVLSGGDQSPSGLKDAPRIFAYEVRTAEGESVTVSYTAYPPSPVADRQNIELDFHAGQIQAGDFLVASGTFDPSTQTLTVAEEGDFIHTYLEKP